MEIQWSLVLFTVLTGAGGWMLACVAIDEFAGKTRATNKLAVVVAAVVACAGGIASVTHLSHPEHIMGALSHPTSGIFVEAALTGLMAVCAIVYFVLLVREASAGARKAFAVLGAVFGVLLSFMAGESYMMSSQLAWNTPLLPLGYAGTAMPLGVALYLALAAWRKEPDTSLFAKLLVAGGVVAALTAAAYGVVSGAVADQALLVWGLAVIVGGAAPAALGALAAKTPEQALSLAAAAAVCCLAGATAYRCTMWLASVTVNNFFGLL